MKFFDPDQLNKLSQEEIRYIKNGIATILNHYKKRKSSRHRLEKAMFKIWGYFEYKTQKSDDTASILFPFSNDEIVEQKASWGLSDVGKDVIKEAVFLLQKYYIIEVVWGNGALDTKGEVKEDVYFTGNFIPEEMYQEYLHSSKGYRTKLVYRPRDLHLLETYHNPKPMAIIRSASRRERKASKHAEVMIARINSKSRNIRLSYKGKPVTYTEIFNENESTGGRLYTNVQNIPKEHRMKIFKKEGFTETFDLESAKFALLYRIIGQQLEEDPYVALAKELGYGPEYREEFKTFSQVLMGTVGRSEKTIKRTVIKEASRKGMVVNKRMYYLEFQEPQWKGILDIDELVEAVNTKDTEYPARIEKRIDDKIKEKTHNRFTLGKLRSFMKGDVEQLVDGVLILNRDENNKPVSIALYDTEGNVQEWPYELIALGVALKKALKTYYRLLRIYKNSDKKFKPLDIDKLLYVFYEKHAGIIQLLESNEIDYMNLESRLSIKVLDMALSEDVYVINMHDGYVYKKEDEKRFKEIIDFVYYLYIFQVIREKLFSFSPFIRKLLEDTLNQIFNPVFIGDEISLTEVGWMDRNTGELCLTG